MSALFHLRRVLLLAITAILAVADPAAAEIHLTDIKGRQLTLAAPAHHILIDDGRLILALSFLTDDPVALIAAWPHDIDRFGREIYREYQAKFSAIDALPKSASSTQDILLEKVIAAKPDLVVLSLYARPAEEQIRQLEALGIPVMFVDFVADPLANTDRSLALLGQATDHEDRAKTIIDFRAQQRAKIASMLAAKPQTVTPTIFMETHASTTAPCCNSPGTGSIGRFIDFLGARNLGDVLKAKPSGQLDPEYVATSRPDIYVASGGEYMEKRGGLLIGPRYSAADTKASMDRLLARPGFAQLPAVQSGRVHGISQQLFNSPFDILALELLAKWSYPQTFGDLDIESVRQGLNKLSAVPLTGTYWTE